ncbi:MAG: hypothetical protein ACR2MA_12980 [Egibacteraceae bacterium]
MDLARPHALIGLLIVSAWAILAGWGVALRFTRYEETPTYWRAVSVGQILLGLQLLYGLVLFGVGRLPGEGGWFVTLFHPLYGFVFPLLVLFFAHKWARERRYDPHLAFGVASFVIFALTVRAWMVGAGIG